MMLLDLVTLLVVLVVVDSLELLVQELELLHIVLM
jgi:hypothetical protein